MKDGKPCRVCVDFKTWSKLEKSKAKSDTKAESSTHSQQSASRSAAVSNEALKQQSTDDWKQKNCPADVETLGRHTWTLLHTMAAYYPEKPEKKQQESMKTFFESFAENYPCWFCKNDFKQDMGENPIDVTSRESLSQWLCKRHNKVNEKLGKKQFDCSKVFERWLTGPPNGKCD
ncbi:ERV/ALR sulfhydryl oxidase domain-containing protein [Blakeslea trispora]|nr:ERV/ALR sulfhydryl oxidase domain-containing protein [Blakeslea trispora]